uniref:Uncharacterized protein n=1 Tax=Equid alphaherpesvirus 1 TaxID=10326 RepID=Q69268_9ALPH|nr:unknown protein [Equid alphaherpesvirus 1]
MSRGGGSEARFDLAVEARWGYLPRSRRRLYLPRADPGGFCLGGARRGSLDI